MITARERISFFINEPSICISRIGSGNCAHFPQLDEVSIGEISLLIVTEINKIFAGVMAVPPRLLSIRIGFYFAGLDAGAIYF